MGYDLPLKNDETNGLEGQVNSAPANSRGLISCKKNRRS